MVSRTSKLATAYAESGGLKQIFSSKVADYVASRPDYPAALFDVLIELGGLSSAASVVDVGAGTGLLSQGLLERGVPVLGVEPNVEMRAAATALLSGYRNFSCLPGSAEDLPLAASSADLVCAAHAFHWFDLPKTREEFLRVLKPSGQVALIWNDRLLTDPLHQGLNLIFERFGGAKREALIAHENRRDIDGFFGPTGVDHREFPHEHSISAAALQSLVMSRSYMPPPRSDEAQQAREATARLLAELGFGDMITIRYVTHVYLGRPEHGTDASAR